MGEPKTKGSSEWRYGRKGSLKIGLPGTDGGGSWYCFESGTSGGVFALIEREAKLSSADRHAAAIKWLRDRGMFPERSVSPRGGRNESSARPKSSRTSRSTPAPRGVAREDAREGASDEEPPPHTEADFPPAPAAPSTGAPQATARPTKRPPDGSKPKKSSTPEPAAVWAAGIAPDPDSPAWRYLAQRLAWPPTNSIFPDLPPSVRWMPRDGRGVPAKLLQWMPKSAAGLVLCAFHRWVDGERRDPLAAVSMEAITATGAKCEPRWRRTFGSRRNALFDAGLSDHSRPDHIVLVEGEVSALAAR